MDLWFDLGAAVVEGLEAGVLRAVLALAIFPLLYKAITWRLPTTRF